MPACCVMLLMWEGQEPVRPHEATAMQSTVSQLEAHSRTTP